VDQNGKPKNEKSVFEIAFTMMRPEGGQIVSKRNN
jgi:hypothetical protein